MRRIHGGGMGVDKRELKRGGMVEEKRSQKMTLALTFVSYEYKSMRRKWETNRQCYSHADQVVR